MNKFSVLVSFFAACLIVSPALSSADDLPREEVYNKAFCDSVGGAVEEEYSYTHPTGKNNVKVDCETEDMVYEGGKDKRSSLDSVQQALFFASLTGKEPVVVIYDTDGKMGRFEHRIRVACVMARVKFVHDTTTHAKVTTTN